MSSITLTVSGPQEKNTVSLTEFQQFHNIDRAAYFKLVSGLGLDSDMSMKIIALWKWLETKGYRNFTYNSLILTKLSFHRLCGLALESAFCLGYLDLKSFSHGNILPVMSEVSDRELSLEFVFENKEDAKANVITFVRDVCQRAFIDLVPTINLNHQVQVFEPVVELLQPQVNILRQEGNGNRGANRQVNKADPDRTLFATFSKGYPVTREELLEFFVRRHGEECVEDIRMSKYSDQSLYALVIVSSPAYIKRILGENEVIQFNIHKKDVRVRRFIPKRAPVAAASAN